MGTGTLTIDLDALTHNWRALDRLNSGETGVSIKADAYGLGVGRVARRLSHAGARTFFVAVAEEGAALREALGPGPEIFVFSGHMPGDGDMIRDLGLTPMLNSVDHSRLMTNDIWALRCAYGVEAARMNIVEQIRAVFGVYGITVDPRHLSLIADYMTFEGGFKAMNRIGMEESGSPFLQMSFETTVHFLRQSAMAEGGDTLTSPSANLVVGKPIRHGTGSFAVLAK